MVYVSVILCKRPMHSLFRPQIAFLCAVAVVLLGRCDAFAQPVDIYRDASRLDELVNVGKYSEAMEFGQSILDRLNLRQRRDQAYIFLAYLGKAALESGLPRQASAMLNAAEAVAARNLGYRYYEPVLFREKAALHYAAAEYAAAAEAAVRAYRLSNEHDYYRIRSEYCHSLQALALLRMGNVREAERLALIAAKAAPTKTDAYPLFAPRILYAACIVEGYAGRMTDAEAFCRRGLEISSNAKLENRDLSLGYLALAEVRLQAGDLTRSREAALRSNEIVNRLFGSQHQDTVDALILLAKIDVREGDLDAARDKVNQAIRIAAVLFGEGSTAAELPARVLR